MAAVNKTHVIKLGGSLLDLSGLAARLGRFLQNCSAHQRLLIVGGGGVADLVRQFDTLHHLGKEHGHWLAVRAMHFNTHLVMSMVSRCRLVVDVDSCRAAWSAQEIAVVDPLAWLANLKGTVADVPHQWTFTSDSIAARIAIQVSADQLVLLKSTSPPRGCGLKSAAAIGLVDPDFPVVAAGVPIIEVVNLRGDPKAGYVLK